MPKYTMQLVNQSAADYVQVASILLFLPSFTSTIKMLLSLNFHYLFFLKNACTDIFQLFQISTSFIECVHANYLFSSISSFISAKHIHQHLIRFYLTALAFTVKYSMAYNSFHKFFIILSSNQNHSLILHPSVHRHSVINM